MKLQRILSVIVIASMSVLLCVCGVNLDKVQSALEKSEFEDEDMATDQFDFLVDYADEFCDNLGISQPGSLF